MRVPREVAATYEAYRDDPVGFVRDQLGLSSAVRRSDGAPYQFDVLRALVTNEKVTLRSGHGVGKTTLVVCAAVWWLLTRPYSRVVIVAPEFARQIKGVIWAHFRRVLRAAPHPLPLEVRANRLLVAGHGDEWSAVGMPATEPDRLEGIHADGGVLLIMDETKGIGQDVYDALQGVLSGGGRLLVASVPGGASGPFYRSWNAADTSWCRFHLSSEDSSLVAPEWVAARREEWGAGSPLFEARVRGEFVSAGEGVLFPLSLLEAVTTRPPNPAEEVTLGVDVARSLAGDWNCVAVARGSRVVECRLWRSADLMLTVHKVMELAVLTGAKRLRVDVGGVGAGVVDRMRQLGYNVEAVNFGGRAEEADRFRNRRAELFFSLRQRLEQDAGLPDDDALVADLSALRYEFDAAGRIVLEGKDEVRRRLGRSPDRADAVALAIGGSTRTGQPWKPVRVIIY